MRNKDIDKDYRVVFKLSVWGAIAVIFVKLAFLAGIISVAVHFINKYW